MATYRGSCHCGNIEVEFDTDIDPGQMTVRACQCSFCRKHGARTAVDPQGQVRIRAKDEGLLARYQWNLRTAEFLLCARCGCYAGAVTSPDRSLATVNVNVLDDAARFTQPAQS